VALAREATLARASGAALTATVVVEAVDGTTPRDMAGMPEAARETVTTETQLTEALRMTADIETGGTETPAATVLRIAARRLKVTRDRPTVVPRVITVVPKAIHGRLQAIPLTEALKAMIGGLALIVGEIDHTSHRPAPRVARKVAARRVARVTKVAETIAEIEAPPPLEIATKVVTRAIRGTAGVGEVFVLSWHWLLCETAFH